MNTAKIKPYAPPGAAGIHPLRLKVKDARAAALGEHDGKRAVPTPQVLSKNRQWTDGEWT